MIYSPMEHSTIETGGGNVKCTTCDKWATTEKALSRTRCNPDHDRRGIE